MKKRGEDVTFGQLRTFICAAQSGSFVRAADQLDISQPAVSEQITALEMRLDCKLFLRRPGTTPILTAEGAQVLEKARALVSSCEELVTTMQDKAKSRTRIKLSIGGRLKESCLKPLLPTIYREMPDIQVEVAQPLPIGDMVAALERGQVDLCVTILPSAVEHWPHVKYVSKVPLVLIAAPDIAASIENGSVQLDELQYIFPGSYALVGSWAEGVLAEAGISPSKEPLYVEFPDVVPELVEQGQGVSIMMYETVAHQIRNGRIEVIDAPLKAMTRVIARSPKATQRTLVLEQHIRSALEQMNRAEIEGYNPVHRKFTSRPVNPAACQETGAPY